jgi:acetyltransferase-like isoleucine patch superfamily enzyme
MPRLGVVVTSAVLLGTCRARRRNVQRISCEGKRPKLHWQGRVVIGDLAVRGVIAPVELGAVAGGALLIGDRVFINQGASVVAHESIELGDDVHIGDFAMILDSDHHPVDELTPTRTAPVVIEHNAWIGSRAVVLPGVRIGAHAVVAAGAVVAKDVPSRTLVAGVPATVQRTLTADDEWRRG